MDRAQRARVFSYLGGGIDWDREDGAVGARVAAAAPGPRQVIQSARRFSAQAAAAAGLPLVIFGGHGFPAGEAPHLSCGPGTACLYADGDEAVRSAREASIKDEAGDVRAVAVTARVTRPGDVMRAVAGAGLPPGPLQVQIGLAPGIWPYPGLGAVVLRWARVLRALRLHGSQVAVLVPVGGYLGHPDLFRVSSRHRGGDAEQWIACAGLDLLCPAADVRAWPLRPGWDENGPRVRADTAIIAAIGVLPALGGGGAQRAARVPGGDERSNIASPDAATAESDAFYAVT